MIEKEQTTSHGRTNEIFVKYKMNELNEFERASEGANELKHE